MAPVNLSQPGGGGGGGGRNRSVQERMLRCHDKIRLFLDVAQRVVQREGDEQQCRDGAYDVARYFRESFADHTADENLSVFPRLAGLAEPALAFADRAIAEHVRDELLVSELVTLCDQLALAEADPARVRLAAVLAELTPRLLDHLAFEEEFLFPLFAQLAPAEEAAMSQEMFDRRVARRGP